MSEKIILVVNVDGIESCGDGRSAVKEMRSRVQKWLEIRTFAGLNR